jgi:hypothetical protein
MIAKENTPKVFARLNAMPWEATPIAHTTTGIGHGRSEKLMALGRAGRPGRGSPPSAGRFRVCWLRGRVISGVGWL